MVKRQVRDITTVTVIGSRVVARPDGSTALALTTEELGTIAFRIDLENIQLLRKDLDAAEAILLRPVGRA